MTYSQRLSHAVKELSDHRAYFDKHYPKDYPHRAKVRARYLKPFNNRIWYLRMRIRIEQDKHTDPTSDD